MKKISAQEFQNQIFQKMNANKKIEVIEQLYLLGCELGKTKIGKRISK